MTLLHSLGVVGTAFLILLSGEAPQAVVRYLRPAGDAFTLESEITQTKTATGFDYVSITHRPKTIMKLHLKLDSGQKPTTGDIDLKNGDVRQTASVHIEDGTAIVKRNYNQVQRLPLPHELAVITTAPDWSDIILLLRRYDPRKSGKQQFAGLWFHPTQEARVLTFEVERLGSDDFNLAGRRLSLARFNVRLRSGDYLVWADDAGLVHKLMPPTRPRNAVVLEKFAEAKLLPGNRD